MSRRERLRAEALSEITTLAMAQVAEGGPAALSLNAIARQMGMSGPAIYRYFASRDELLTRLVVDVYTNLAAALADAAERASRRGPENRLRALADAYRDWALDHPREYRLLFAGGLPKQEPPEIAQAAHRAMELILATLRDLAGGEAATAHAVHPRLASQLADWALKRGAMEHLPPWLLRLGVVTWQRLHGHMALELEGIHVAMGLDPRLLYRSEVDVIVHELTGT